MRYSYILAAGALFVVAGCSRASVPLEQLSNTKASLGAAKEAGATQVPQAVLHIKLAQDELAKAESLFAAGEAKQGQLLLNEAQADADLALALAREQDERSQARAEQEKISNLRSRSQ